MDQVNFQAVAELAKIAMVGIRSQQIGDMAITEKDLGCDLVVQYTKAAKFEEGAAVLTLSIRFNDVREATHAREILRHGSADLGPDPIRAIPQKRDEAFIASL